MNQNHRSGAYEIPSYRLALMWRRVAKKSQQANLNKERTA